MQEQLDPFRDADQIPPAHAAALPTHPRPSQGPIRLLRAAVLTGSSLALAVGAHAAGGGRVPGLPGLGLLTLAVFAVAFGTTAVRLRLPTLLAAVGAGQWLIHHALMALTATTPAPADLTLHAHHGAMRMDSLTVTSHPAMAMTGTSTSMLAAHAAAAAATAWLLSRGEATLWKVVARLVPLRPGRRPTPTRTLLLPVPVHDRFGDQAAPWAAPSRGPPALALTA